MFRSNWRGAEVKDNLKFKVLCFNFTYRNHFTPTQEWAAEGLPIKSTTSNEAIKLYDSALTQVKKLSFWGSS